MRNAGGTAIATVDRQVSPFGSFRGSLSEVFGGERNYDDASHVIARSVPANIFSQEVNIVGFEVVRNFSRADSSQDKILGRTDWAALSAVPATGTGSSLTFPHVIRGMDRFSLIGLVNTGSTDQSVTLTYSIANSFTALSSGPVLIRAQWLAATNRCRFIWSGQCQRRPWCSAGHGSECSQGISRHRFFKWLVDRRSARTGDRANGILVSFCGAEHHSGHWGCPA